jgi:thiol:disulfide interchange protein
VTHTKRLTKLALSTAVATLIIAGCGGREPEPPPVAGTITTHETTSVRWETDFSSALERARKEDKPVLVNFYADWCVWCKRLESTTFRDGKVASMLQNQMVPISLDVEGDGRDLSNQYRVDGLPTIIVVDGDGRELGRIPGYMPPAGFLEQIQGFIQQS